MNKVIEVIHHLRTVSLLRDGAGLTDAQLLGYFVERRDEAAFAALVKQHGPMVWGICRRLLNQQDAEDAFQTTFLVLVRKAASIVPRERVANWLYGVAHQTALHARRTVSRRRAREKQVTQMPEPAVIEQDFWRELQPLLDQELSRLPDAYREAIVLCDLEGKTRKEVARQLGLPEGTVGSRLARARTMLAKRLARHGLAVSGAALAAVLAKNAASANVPASLLTSTIKAATLIAAGKAATAGIVSSKVAVLIEGVLKTMLLTKLKIVAVVILAMMTIVGLGTGLLSYDTAAMGRQHENNKGNAVAPRKGDEPQKSASLSPSRSLKGDYSFAHLSWGRDGKTLATITLEVEPSQVDVRKHKNAVLVWDVQTGSIKRTFAKDLIKDHSWTQAGVGFSLDGRSVAAATYEVRDGLGVGLLVLWDAKTAKVTHRLKHDLLVQCFAFSPDGRMVVTGTGGNIDRDFETVKLWNAKTGKLMRTLETTNKMAVRVAFAPNSKLLAAVLQQDRTLAEVILWDAAEEKQPLSLPDSDDIQVIAFSPDGKILVGAARNKLCVWDVATGKTIQSSEIKTDFSVRDGGRIALSPDGLSLAISGKQEGKHVIAVFDVKTAMRTKTLEGHEGVILSLGFSPDGNTLASGSIDGTIYLWDFNRGTKDEK